MSSLRIEESQSPLGARLKIEKGCDVVITDIQNMFGFIWSNRVYFSEDQRTLMIDVFAPDCPEDYIVDKIGFLEFFTFLPVGEIEQMIINHLDIS